MKDQTKWLEQQLNQAIEEIAARPEWMKTLSRFEGTNLYSSGIKGGDKDKLLRSADKRELRKSKIAG